MTLPCRRPSPHRILGPLAGVALMCAPAPALAGTVSVEAGEVVFQAEPGEVNDVTVLEVLGGGRSVVDLGAPLVRGVGCQTGSPMICDGGNALIFLGDRDDRGVTRSGGGNQGYVYGERGDDSIHSDGETAYADGGPGEDDIAVSANVAYGYGGPGDDSITGQAGVYNELRGEGGDDHLVLDAGCALLDGGRGNDRIVGRDGGCSGPVLPTQIGGNGDDSMGFDASSRGTSEAWILDGGRGDDSMTGSSGPDRFDAGRGWDYVDAAGDGAGDTIVCGPGRDTVITDPSDAVAEDCERVTVTTP